MSDSVSCLPHDFIYMMFDVFLDIAVLIGLPKYVHDIFVDCAGYSTRSLDLDLRL